MEDSVGARSVAFIAVTYRSDHAALNFARQIAGACAREDVAGIIVDNENRDAGGIGEALRTVNPHIHYLQLPGNAGYFPAAERGREWLVANWRRPYWTIVCNSDLEFDGEAFIAGLQSVHVPAAGVVAPSIISARTGLDQNPNMARRPRPGRMHFYRWVFGRFWLRWLYQSLAELAAFGKSAVRTRTGGAPRLRPAATSRSERPERIYAPHGACLLFTDAYFRAGGTLNYPEVLYGEEVFVAETCRKLGLDVLYVPGLRVRHLEHTSTDNMSPREIASFAAAASSHIAQEYFTARRVQH